MKQKLLTSLIALPLVTAGVVGTTTMAQAAALPADPNVIGLDSGGLFQGQKTVRLYGLCTTDGAITSNVVACDGTTGTIAGTIYDWRPYDGPPPGSGTGDEAFIPGSSTGGFQIFDGDFNTNTSVTGEATITDIGVLAGGFVFNPATVVIGSPVAQVPFVDPFVVLNTIGDPSQVGPTKFMLNSPIPNETSVDILGPNGDVIFGFGVDGMWYNQGTINDDLQFNGNISFTSTLTGYCPESEVGDTTTQAAAEACLDKLLTNLEDNGVFTQDGTIRALSVGNDNSATPKAVPEPSAMMGLLAALGLGTFSTRKRKG